MRPTIRLGRIFGIEVGIHWGLPGIRLRLAGVSLVLGIFTLLPGAPLDGGRVLAALVWMHNGDRRRAQIVAARAGRVLGTVLIAGSLALVFAGQDLIFTALVGWFVLSASA